MKNRELTAIKSTANGVRSAYASVIFLGAFLIFQVQPMISKFILPWFGGTPSVWTVCMLFFQVFLFGGYLYAHLLTSKASPRVQSVIHVILLSAAAALVLIRSVLPQGLKPLPAAIPVLHILFTLVVTIGLPYFILAATSPLLQFWFVRNNNGKEPYIFYSVSNIGSFLALISYPVIVEPFLALPVQSLIWSLCFTCFAAGCTIIALVSDTHKDLQAKNRKEASAARNDVRKPGIKQTPGRIITSIKSFEKILWILLPLLSAILLVAVTNQLCTDVSSGPFLWVLPLCIYLLTFILTFTGWRFIYNRIIFFILLAAGFILISFILQRSSWFPFFFQIVAYSIVLYCGCTALHSELYRRRPCKDMLTQYYLFISLGGALGGIFVGIIAPVIFRDYFELHLVSIAILIGMIVVGYRDKTFFPRTHKTLPGRAIMLILPGLITLVVASLFLYQVYYKMNKAREVRRNFFGVVQVQELSPETPAAHSFRLIHGTTYHGIQFADPSFRNFPTAYYSPKSGIGIVLTSYSSDKPLRVGAIGLGIGTIAAYARPGDTYCFYEINPDVIAFASDERYFHYLKDAQHRGAKIEIIQGDGRLSMENEAKGTLPSGNAGAVGNQPYDVIVLDAFSSDSIPMHLLTVEAFQSYFNLLAKDGIIAVHITNQNLDLFPVVAAIALKYRVPAILMMNEANPQQRVAPAYWVLLTNNKFFVDTYYKAVLPKQTNLWTDNFSNLLSAIR
ncbi:MAG TPA: hypothetical protein VHP38_09435 [Ruminiclostridium sp.]|nr:hypothetical protein [Ruminiclostridium sp.]